MADSLLARDARTTQSAQTSNEIRPSSDSEGNTVLAQTHELLVYNCTSGQFNPITWTEFLCDYMLDTRKYVKYKPALRRPRFTLHRSKLVNSVHEFFSQSLFGNLVDPLLVISGRKPMLRKAYAKVSPIQAPRHFVLNV
jgi:hypothetical protein